MSNFPVMIASDILALLIEACDPPNHPPVYEEAIEKARAAIAAAEADQDAWTVCIACRNDAETTEIFHVRAPTEEEAEQKAMAFLFAEDPPPYQSFVFPGHLGEATDLATQHPVTDDTLIFVCVGREGLSITTQSTWGFFKSMNPWMVNFFPKIEHALLHNRGFANSSGPTLSIYRHT